MKFFLLDKQQNIIGRLSEEYILEATFTEEINTAGELLITLPAKKRLSGNVIHVLITNPSKDHSYLMFKIIKETVKDEEVEYTAVESAYDELTSYGYIQDKRPTANAQTITEMILKDTRWHVGEIPDTSEAFISFYYLSVLDCLKKIVQTFDFEIGFDVLINDDENQITDRRVNFYIKQGEQTGKRFEYGSNLLSVKQEQDTQNIYTALVGRGKGVQVSGDDDDNTPDGYGRRITFADVEWSKSNGDPLDKPKGQEWLEDPDATKQLGFSDGHMRIGLEVFEDVDDPKTLLQKTYEALKTTERPQVQFSASVINTGELHLGDRVGITRNDIGIAYETRVFKVQHNLLDETQNKIDLGDNLEQTNNLSYQVSALQSEVTNNTEGIITVTQSANGKNKVYYSSTMPATGSNGDVWYKDLGNGETEMYIYDNGWQLVISTENLHKIEDEIKQQQTALDQAVQDANAASVKVAGLVAQVGDANTNAQKALTTAQQNQADLAQAKNDLENTKNQLTNVQSDLTKQAKIQGQTIVDIQKTQSGLSADIADVKGNVSSLQDTANGLESTVQGNSGQISQVKQTADSLQSSITQKIGTYLPNGDFDDKDISKYWVPWDTTKDLSEISVQPTHRQNMPANYLKITTKSSENKTDIGTKDYIPVNVNEGLEIKAWSWLSAKNGDDTAFQFYVHSYDKDNNEIDSWQGWFKYDNLQEWEQTDVSWGNDSWNKDTVSIRLEIVIFGGGIDTYGAITGLKIINGSSGIASQFTQTIDSLTSKIADADGNISQLKQTSDSLTSQIGSANSDISSLKQRADSMESNISDNKNDISDLKQTASSLQSNIQSKTDISQFTQLSNAFQTVVQNIGPFYPDGDFSDTDLSKYYDPWDTCTSLDNFSVVTDNSNWGYYLQICTPQGTVNKMITKEYLPINANYPITFKGKSLLSYDGELKGKFQVYYHFYDSNKNQVGSLYVDWYKYDNNNVWQDFSSTLTPPSGAVYLRIETVLDNSEGTGTYWGALDNLSIENGEATIASKISQMSDDINLRVQKGDLLSQINIQAGSTLIQSKKLFLDASSVVFSGNAFIPSAAITDLSADKITAGTLNAGNVNIINLDVNKLVGNTTEFVRSGWTNAYGSHVQIDGGEMSITYGDWLTKFEPDGMVFRDGNEDIGGFTRIGMQNAPSWYGGLAFNAGGDAEFLSIGAKDYHNDSQNPIPAKLVWMRQGINTYGYNSGWNFCDDVWAGKIGMSEIQYQGWNIHFGEVADNNGFSALTLTSGSGDGFYWGSDGTFGYVTGGNNLHNVRGSQIVYDINQNGGTCQTWSGVD